MGGNKHLLKTSDVPGTGLTAFLTISLRLGVILKEVSHERVER